MHIKYLVILTCSFQIAAILYFALICCPAHIDSHRDSILYVLMYLFLTYMDKRHNVTVTYFLKFKIIFLKFIFSLLRRHLNFLCFDIWATKLCILTELCAKLPNEGPYGPIFDKECYPITQQSFNMTFCGVQS